jgi:hypothetical protein
LGAALSVSKPAKNRSGFIGSSVARIIMGTYEAAQAGIQFIDDDEMGGFGLRIAKKKRKR